MPPISYQPLLSDLAFRVVRTQLALLHSHEAGARAGHDPEELHDMRVATRRLRAALRCFQEVLPPDGGLLYHELGWLASGLSTVRDLDVQLARVQELALVVPAAEQDSLGVIVEILQQDRARARESL